MSQKVLRNIWNHDEKKFVAVFVTKHVLKFVTEKENNNSISFNFKCLINDDNSM